MQCFLCPVRVKGNYSQLTNRLHLFHGFLKTTGNSNKTLFCGNADCRAGFNSFAKYRDHVINCVTGQKLLHPGSDKTIRVEPVGIAIDLNSESLLTHNDTLPISDTEVCVDLDQKAIEISDKTTHILARCFLELRAKHNVCHSAIDFIAKNIDGVFKDVVNLCDLEKSMALTNVEKAASRLNSHVKRIRYYTSNMGFVEPVAKCADSNNQPEVNVNSRGVTEQKKEYLRVHFNSENVE